MIFCCCCDIKAYSHGYNNSRKSMIIMLTYRNFPPDTLQKWVEKIYTRSSTAVDEGEIEVPGSGCPSG